MRASSDWSFRKRLRDLGDPRSRLTNSIRSGVIRNHIGYMFSACQENNCAKFAADQTSREGLRIRSIG
jgi:hypothetical protein